MPSVRRTAKLTAATPKPAKTEQREVTVLKRACVTKANAAYFVNPGDVICLVKNGGGRVYTTILRRETKQHTCTCEGNAKWHRRCYHIDHCVAAENARWDAERDAAALIAEAEGLVVEATEPVVEIAVELPEELRGHRKTLTVRGPVLPRIAAREAETTKVSDAVGDVLAFIEKAKVAKEAKSPAKSTEQAMMDAPLTKNNQGFRVLR